MKYSEVHIFMCGYGTVLQEVVKWNYHYKNDMCHVLPYLFCGAGDQTQGFPCANQTICFLKRNIGPSIYLYMHVLVEMWYSGCLYHRKIYCLVYLCFHFFSFIVEGASVCAACIWHVACVFIGEKLVLGFSVYHFTPCFWDRVSLLSLQLTGSTRLPGQWIPRILLSLLPHQITGSYLHAYIFI